MGGLGLTGYHLATGTTGKLTRTLQGLDVGREYRLSVRYARDSRSAGTAPGTANLAVGGLSADLSAGTDQSSQNAFATYVGTFTATARRMPLSHHGGQLGCGARPRRPRRRGHRLGRLRRPGALRVRGGHGDNCGQHRHGRHRRRGHPGGHHRVEPERRLGGALDLKGGTNANTVDLPDNLLQGEANFTTSFWVRPDTKGNWINLFHIGDGLEGAGSFFQIQMQTDAAPGGTGLAATFKKKGSTLQERIYADPDQGRRGQPVEPRRVHAAGRHRARSTSTA